MYLWRMSGKTVLLFLVTYYIYIVGWLGRSSVGPPTHTIPSDRLQKKSESNLTFDHAIVYCCRGFRGCCCVGKVGAGTFCTVLFEKD